MKKFPLHIVSQERILLSEDVESVTVPTAEGEITVLEGHIPLFAKVQTGQLVYRTGQAEASIIVSDGFVNIAPSSAVTVMVDSGVLEREISLEKAQKALQAAQETMQKTQDQRELILAEASLKQAMMEVKVAQKSRKATI